ncbi:eCIS core domain-containing protein [Streptomyces alanosinicus]|uniref:eCIS core domain-containing protein n=1 Tax=Streptomyces alanosinicus TaxID=68171 RepID=A0A918YMD9_9ACTN|nr:DUF4157 domain-containing protein [Streptomyces alanosinicus]GHE08557.1 hypothetical protein GCM10010339_57770 [Streptomyces alanosinicus]
MSGSTAAAGLTGRPQPLEAGVRDQLSARFGHDFSPVRVHVGPEADAAARALDAKAYTVGHDVAFAHGSYDPLTASGRSLIAHELAHVVQHGGTAHAPNFLAGEGGRLPAASAPLERQADLAAALSDRPLPRAWAWQRATAPFLGRAETGWNPITVDYVKAGEQRPVKWKPGGTSGVIAVDMGEFILPYEKGPWEDVYQEAAKADQLEATICVVPGQHPSVAMKQKREEPTSRLWLQRVQWPEKDAPRLWHDAGGSAGSTLREQTTADGVQFDHIVELQVGGSNDRQNFAPHKADLNMSSGATIAQSLFRAARSAQDAVKGHPEAERVENVVLKFSGATQKPSKYPRPASLPSLKSQTNVEEFLDKQRRGKATEPLQIHFTALQDLEEGTRPGPVVSAGTEGLVPYTIKAGANSAVLLVPGKPADEPVKLDGSPIAQNHNARLLIPVLILDTLHRGKKADYITARVDTRGANSKKGTKIPLLLQHAKGAKPKKGESEEARAPIRLNVGADGVLKLNPQDKKLKVAYPFLSSGHLDVDLTEGGLVGKGVIKPDVPLLRGVDIGIELDSDGLKGSVNPKPEELTLPPFEVTESTLSVNLAEPFSAEGHVGFALGQRITGRLDAKVDSDGLFAAGAVRARIPGTDEAKGTVEYRPGTGLRGHADVKSTRPSGLVRSADVRVGFDGVGWQASGTAGLQIGTTVANLEVSSKGDRIVYAGLVKLTPPGLQELDFHVSYDGEHLTGTGHTTFAVHGVSGDLTVAYRDDRFTGHGTAALEHGRVHGSLKVVLDEQGRISGRGEALVTVREGLTGKAVLVLSPDQRLRVEGELRFPPYRFLERRGNRYQLFHYDLPEIPLFAIPLGPKSIGLVATISAGMAAQYSFGPGEIRDMVISAAFNPLEQDSDLEVGAEARLVLPAQAGLELDVRAGVGLSVAVGSVTAGITVTGGVVLKGGLEAGAKLTYARHVLTFDTSAAIRVQPVLTLAIDADIVAHAVLLGEKRWPYRLAAYSYATGLEFGMVAPFHYQSDQPLRLPEAKDIQWIVPDIDVRALAGRIGAQIRAGLGL